MQQTQISAARPTRRQFIALAGGALLAGTAACAVARPDAAPAQAVAEEAADTIVMTDFKGREVEVPYPPQRVGALYGGSWPELVFFGVTDRVVLRFQSISTWMDVICPDAPALDVPMYSNAREPNVEDLLEKDVDLVYYWGDLTDTIDAMTEAGIPVLVGTGQSVRYDDYDEWKARFKEAALLYGKPFGVECEQKVDEWIEYLDEKFAFVEERVATLDDDQIPSVYVMRNQEDGLQCFSNYDTVLIVQAAGGRVVCAGAGGESDSNNFITVTMEQVIDWDPEYVFCGWLFDTDVITSNEQWAPVSAVKAGNVFLNPCSLNATFWDGGFETPLALLYYAKTLHPDLFDDVDLEQEVVDFYRKFYGSDLTLEQAGYMLQRKGPDGGDFAYSY